MAEAARIFVSHAYEDDCLVPHFVEVMRHGGAIVWYDEDNLGYGVLGDEIERDLQVWPIVICETLACIATHDNPIRLPER